MPSPGTTCLRASGEAPGAAAAGPAPSPGKPARGEPSVCRLAGLRALVYRPPSPPPLPGCRFGWGFFCSGAGEELGSGTAFAQLRAPVTLIVTSVPRDKNLLGELGKARCQQVTPPRSGFKSTFKGPRSSCAASRPATMRRSGASPNWHTFLFLSPVNLWEHLYSPAPALPSGVVYILRELPELESAW